MFQLPLSQVVFYHSECFGIAPFNIRTYDRPKELGGEMWQVRWWRKSDPIGVYYEIHTDWNVRRLVSPSEEFIYDAESEQVCTPGWKYWWSNQTLMVPLEDNVVDLSKPDFVLENYGGVLWDRDAQGDVNLYFLEDVNDPEYELNNDYYIPGSGF